MLNSEQSFMMRLLLLARRWKRFLIINTTVFTLAALIISLLLTKIFRAEAKILAGKTDLSAMGLSTLAADLPFQGLGLVPQADETLRYMAILTSRTVMMKIADDFNLQERYDKPDWERTLKALSDNFAVEVNPDESMSVFAYDKSPEFAAQMANAFVRALDSLNIQLKVEKARNNRQFLEERLDECKTELTGAEQKLKEFQEQYGIIEVTEQAVAAIQTMSQIEAEILLKETELRFKQNYLSEYHMEIERLKTNVKELNKTLDKLKYGTPSEAANGNGPSHSFIIPGIEVPQLALQYFRLMRDVEVQNLLFKLLTQQYEQASILEAKETPTVQILDWAIPPVYKYKPKRAFIVLGAFFFSMLMGLITAAGLEKWREIKARLREQTT